MKTLIIYYSRKGENYFGGAIKSIEKGNTEYVAEYIAEAVGADLFEVDTVKPYPADYYECTAAAKEELKANARPELKAYLSGISDYDNIVIAAPCWWGTYPMAVFTQLEKLNFSGKTVFHVMTHEGSGLANSTKALKKYCVGANVGAGLAVHGSEARNLQKSVEKWAKDNLV